MYNVNPESIRVSAKGSGVGGGSDIFFPGMTIDRFWGGRGRGVWVCAEFEVTTMETGIQY